MENVNLTAELSDLLAFVSSTAIAIRMCSLDDFCVKDDPDRAQDIMWLSHSMRNLDSLSESIKTGDKKSVSETTLVLENEFYRYLHPYRYPDSTPQSQEVFEKYIDCVNPYIAIDVFRRIAVKVSEDIGLICANCHHVYWPSEAENNTPPDCEWRKIEKGTIHYLCPSCDSWTVERQVEARGPATKKNLT